jgi:hypothetical protein
MKGVDLSGLTGGAGTKETSVIKDQIKAMQNMLREIDFTPLKSAFAKLREAAAPINEHLFAGLKWAYDNVLVPVGKWAITQAIPAFLNALSGGLEVLNPIIEAFKPLFEWLWHNFLLPVSTWTGGTIVTVLNSIGEALSKIGKWMSENQPVVDRIAKAVALFFGAWTLLALIEFIQMAGGVVGAFAKIAKSVKDLSIEKIKLKGLLLHIRLLYAKEFVASLGKAFLAVVKKTGALPTNTAALIANKVALLAAVVAQKTLTAAMLIWKGVAALATIATAAFGAALKLALSPIGLIVLAIAGLVVGIVLLARNWDTVRAKGAQAWGAIQTAWGRAPEWFRTRITVPLRTLFTELTSGISRMFTRAINWIIDGLNTLIKGLNQIKVNFPSFLGGKSFGVNIPSIPRLASGGIITQPTLAMVGEKQKRGRYTA